MEGTLAKDARQQLDAYLKKSFGVDKVKVKERILASAVKGAVNKAGSIGSNLGSAFGNLAENIKGNEDVQNAIKQTKEVFKSAFGGLFKKK